MTTGEVLSIVLEDRAFYNGSEGGVTVSGGEPLSQADFVAELFTRCREQEVHTCLETSGYGSPQALRTVMPVTDLFLFDWKMHDRKAAMRYIGGSLSPILRSFHKLMESGCKVLLRCPIIPRVNDSPAHFDSILRLLDEFPQLLGGVAAIPACRGGQKPSYWVVPAGLSLPQRGTVPEMGAVFFVQRTHPGQTGQVASL